jgi:hypothetical protein
MAWFLALQGPAHMTSQAAIYELQDSVDVEKISRELVSSATLDRVVPIPAVLAQNNGRHQQVTLYVRPAAWGVWVFYQLSQEERRQLAKENPLLNALAQAAAAQQRGQAGTAGQPASPAR